MRNSTHKNETSTLNISRHAMAYPRSCLIHFRSGHSEARQNRRRGPRRPSDVCKNECSTPRRHWGRTSRKPPPPPPPPPPLPPRRSHRPVTARGRSPDGRHRQNRRPTVCCRYKHAGTAARWLDNSARGNGRDTSVHCWNNTKVF